MTRTCDRCQIGYDDAAQSTICPHRRWLTEPDQARKDLALSLLGRDLRWADDVCGHCPPLRITSVTWNGMVTLAGWIGEFTPHDFVALES